MISMYTIYLILLKLSVVIVLWPLLRFDSPDYFHCWVNTSRSRVHCSLTKTRRNGIICLVKINKITRVTASLAHLMTKRKIHYLLTHSLIYLFFICCGQLFSLRKYNHCLLDYLAYKWHLFGFQCAFYRSILLCWKMTSTIFLFHPKRCESELKFNWSFSMKKTEFYYKLFWICSWIFRSCLQNLKLLSIFQIKNCWSYWKISVSLEFFVRLRTFFWFLDNQFQVSNHREYF